MDKVKALRNEAKAKYQEAIDAAENGEIEHSEELIEEAENLEQKATAMEKALSKSQTRIAELSRPVMPAPLPDDGDGQSGTATGKGTIITPEPAQPEEDPEETFQKSVNHLRYARVDLSQLSIDELCNFKAMTELYGADHRRLNDDQNRAFERYLRGHGFDSPQQELLLKRMYWILRQAAGLTAVRAAGALIVQTSSKMIEWLKIT